MNLQAFRLLGIILVELDRAGDALNAFLTALDLDPERADEMTTYIATVSTFFCEIPKDVLKKIKGISINCYCLHLIIFLNQNRLNFKKKG